MPQVKYQFISKCENCGGELVMFMIDDGVWIGDCDKCKLGVTLWPPDRPIRRIVAKLRPENTPKK